jgi:Fe-S cluster biosynthesis and repair protein YggX
MRFKQTWPISKIREITASHLYQGLNQSPQGSLMFVKNSQNRRALWKQCQNNLIIESRLPLRENMHRYFDEIFMQQFEF